MIVLGLDTATAATAVALRMADGSVGELRDDPEPGAHPGHATRLLALAAQVLSEAGVSWGGVERIAAGVGPGTFTGLRVGIATARGLAQALGTELVGVSSLAALAEPALAEAACADAGGAAASVLAVIDARRGEVFAAAYEPGPAGAPRPLSLPRALAPEDLDPSVLASSGAATTHAVGDGAVRYRGALEAAGITVAPDGDPLHRVSAAAICVAGGRPPAAGDPRAVVPDYVRRPDAELALEGTG